MITRPAFAPSLCIALVSALLSACASSSPSMPGMENAINHEVSSTDKLAAKSQSPLLGDNVVLWVNGLGCPLCASNIDRQLVRVKGVRSVKVDLGNGKVVLGLEPGVQHPSPARLGDAVEDAGFTLVKVEEQ